MAAQGGPVLPWPSLGNRSLLALPVWGLADLMIMMRHAERWMIMNTRVPEVLVPVFLLLLLLCFVPSCPVVLLPNRIILDVYYHYTKTRKELAVV